MPHPPTRLNKIEVVRGETKDIQIEVKQKTGRAANIGGATIYMTVRRGPNEDVLIAKTSVDDGIQITDGANGKAIITLTSNETESLKTGEYRYDAWVVYPGDPPVRKPVVRFAQLHVIDGLTDFPPAA